MSYREELRNASFRGVPFSVTGASDSHGRRGADNEFPDRDTPHSDDQGRRQIPYTIDGYVAGDDYLDRLSDLIDAAEKKGPGVLIHPYYGRRVVVCRILDVRQGVSIGGTADLAWTFREAGELINPTDAGSTQDAVIAANLALAEAVEEDYGAVDDLVGATWAAAQWTAGAQDKITVILEAITGPFTDTVDNLLDIVVSLQKIDQDLQAELLLPSQLAARMLTVFEIIGSLSVIKALTGDSRNSASTLTAADTTDGQTSQDIDEANRALNQRYAMTRHAALLADEDFTSLDQAIAERDAFAALTDAELSVPPADDTFAALTDLNGASARDIDQRSQDLPSIVTISVPVARPALVMAQELYGDPTREGEILTRNNVAHPAFVSGDVQVLTR
jgi:prophage DNA circulation protein